MIARQLIRAMTYRQMAETWPMGTDLDRLYCKDAGKPGHTYCGKCVEHGKPRFLCTALHKNGRY